MTDELKTLKDIKYIRHHSVGDIRFTDFASVNELRAEAIRRAKTKIEWLTNNSAVKKFWLKGNPMVVIEAAPAIEITKMLTRTPVRVGSTRGFAALDWLALADHGVRSLRHSSADSCPV